MTYLVIVDVQESFLAAHLPELQEGVRQAIAYAVDNSIPIINLRFAYCGETVRPVADLLHEVGHTEVTKSRQSGFTDLCPIIEDGATVLVCGVNTDCCVADTVDDLADAGYNLFTCLRRPVRQPLIFRIFACGRK